MSLELRDKSPEKALAEAQSGIQAESQHLSAKSKAYFERHPDLVGVEGAEHSDGATNQRMADVYAHTSEQISAVLLQHKRDMVRAMNPYFAKKTDAEIDQIVSEYDREGIFG